MYAVGKEEEEEEVKEKYAKGALWLNGVPYGVCTYAFKVSYKI